MVGLALAALLAKSRHAAQLQLTVVDAAERPSYSADDDVGLRVSAISPGTEALFQSLSVWDAVRQARISPFRGMRVWDAAGHADAGDALRFDAADYGVAALGHIIENQLIRDALIAGLESTSVDLRFGSPIEAVSRTASEARLEVTFVDGEQRAPDLVVAADGAASRVRGWAGIPVRAWQYPQAAFVTHVRPEKPHRQVAWQRFLRDGPLALLPLADGRASVVWSTTPERVEQASLADDDQLADMLSSASDFVLGRLNVDGPRGSFPLKAQHAVRYVEPGIALIGDAAHSVHPLAGQGANLGFADAQSLAGAIERALDQQEQPGDLPTLRRYERERRGANGAMLHFIDSINRLFLADKGVLAGVRRRGMALFNRSGPLQRKAVEVALGVRF